MWIDQAQISPKYSKNYKIYNSDEDDDKADKDPIPDGDD